MYVLMFTCMFVAANSTWCLKLRINYCTQTKQQNGSLSTWGQVHCPRPLQWGLRSLQWSLKHVMSLPVQSHFPRSYSSQYSYTRFDLCDIWVVVHEVGLGFAAAAELLVYIIIWSPKWKAMKGPIVAIECVCNNVQHKYCTAICSGQFSQF